MLIFKHMSEKAWCAFLQVRASLFQKDEVLEGYKRSSEVTRSPGFTGGAYTDPIYLTSYVLGARIWTLPTDANYRVKTPAPDPTHTIMNTKLARLVGITHVRPFIYQGILVCQFTQRLCHPTDCMPKASLQAFLVQRVSLFSLWLHYQQLTTIVIRCTVKS